MLGFRHFPRFSLRRFVFFGSAFSLFWILVISLWPITSPLPPYRGTHDVGILDLETEVEKRVIHPAVLKETGLPAFELTTLAITLYYPSNPLPPSSPQPLARPWLPQPLSLIGTGYARVLDIYFPPFQAFLTLTLWALGSSTVIPGIVDAPLLSSPSKILSYEADGKYNEDKVLETTDSKPVKEYLELRDHLNTGGGKFPCIVFTHGMAGMSQSYSHYLGSLASHGYVVAAIEHRDGSGPGSIVHSLDERDKFVFSVNVADLQSEPAMTSSDLKVAQLAFRQAEMEETIRLFQQLNDGHGAEILNLKPESPESALPGFEGRLDLDAVTVIGHSYGATGALQALKSAHTPELPLNGGIALDPGKGSGPLNHDIDVPVLVMQSGEWTEKQVDFYGQGQHFDVVRKLVKSVKEGWFMTLNGTAHPSCTDAPLIVPWIMKMVTGTTLDAQVALREYIDVSVEFLEYLRSGVKKGVLDSGVTSPMGPLGDEEKRGKVKGMGGADWEVHVVPEI